MDLLPTLIESPKSGFVKARAAVSNICKVISVLEYAKIHPNIMLISLDAEKTLTILAVSSYGCYGLLW